jgi:amidase
VYFARIEEVNLEGPGLRAVLELNPSALTHTAAMDQERKLKGKRSLLHGIPVILKVHLNIIIWKTSLLFIHPG